MIAPVILQQKNLDAVAHRFEQNFNLYNELGASLAIHYQGEEVLSLAQGWTDKTMQKAWSSNTLIPVYSATKGPASATLLMALEKHGLTPQHKVTNVWEKFPNPNATFAEMLSHQCGLAAIDKQVSVFDYAAVIHAIEQQKPNWDLGTAHGYHPRTFGFLLDEVCYRLEGKKIGTCFRDWIATPLQIEMWIGLPESEFDRVATLYPGKMTKEDQLSGFYKDFSQEGTLVRRTFNSPKGLQGVKEMNTEQAWTSGLPALGGVATASALAQFYQAVIGELDLFSEQVMNWMATPLISGEDLILKTPTRFSCGFQFDPLDSFGKKIRHNYGIYDRAFGHPGAGGSHAFGDPDSGISLSYTMNQMELAVLPNIKSLSLIEALYAS